MPESVAARPTSASRRQLLKGAAAGVVLVAAGRPALALDVATARRPIELLLGGSPADTSFVAGARAAATALESPEPRVAVLDEAQLFDPVAVGRFLATRQGARIVGLLHDAGYLVFSELARARGATQRLEGRHVQESRLASRHALQAGAGMRDGARLAVASFEAGEGAFALTAWPIQMGGALCLAGPDAGSVANQVLVAGGRSGGEAMRLALVSFVIDL